MPKATPELTDFVTSTGANGQADAPPPKSWIDKDTGHRVVRLTDEPGRTVLASEPSELLVWTFAS